MNWKTARKLTMRCAMLGVTLLATNCASGPPQAIPDRCAGWEPIRPSGLDLDRMSGALVEQILAHDKHGVQLCGWHP